MQCYKCGNYVGNVLQCTSCCLCGQLTCMCVILHCIEYYNKDLLQQGLITRTYYNSLGQYGPIRTYYSKDLLQQLQLIRTQCNYTGFITMYIASGPTGITTGNTQQCKHTGFITMYIALPVWPIDMYVCYSTLY